MINIININIIINNCRWGGRSGGGVYNAGPCSAGSLLSLLPSSFFLPFFCVLFFFFFFFLASVLFLPSSLILPNPSQAIPSHRHPIIRNGSRKAAGYCGSLPEEGVLQKLSPRLAWNRIGTASALAARWQRASGQASASCQTSSRRWWGC